MVAQAPKCTGYERKSDSRPDTAQSSAGVRVDGGRFEAASVADLTVEGPGIMRREAATDRIKREHERKMAGLGAYGRNERGSRSECKIRRDGRVIEGD
jgi:hypothetical protein